MAEEQHELLHEPDLDQDVAEPEAEEVAEDPQLARPSFAKRLAPQEQQRTDHQEQRHHERQDQQEEKDDDAEVVDLELADAREDRQQLPRAQAVEEERAI